MSTNHNLNLKLLENLIMTPGVPGREHRVRALVEKEIKGLFDETRIDPLGSLICVRKPRPSKGKPSAKLTRVMLASHMDQIGFLVKHIDGGGYVKLQPVGGFDTRNLFARTVWVCPDVNDPSKDLLGAMNPAGKPIHIAEESEKNKVPQVGEFMIDLGLPADEVKKKVKIGDMVVMRATFDKVGNTIVGQAMDNRFAVWVAIEAIRALKHHDCEIHAVFTVQEEVGCRGAGTSSYHVDPDIAISLDVTLCCDTPGVPEDQRVTKQGDGAGLLVMDSSMISDLGLVEDFEKAGIKHKVKTQRSILPRGGNDGYAIQLKRAGRRTFTLVCPTRYVHTVTEMIHLDDLDACRKLLTGYLSDVK
jgi:tetrahedral aminopeptidase